MSFYDGYQPPSSGYHKLENQGEQLDLLVTNVKRGKPREATDPDFPVLVGTNMVTGEEGVEFACGSAVLYRLVLEEQPVPGDRVLVTFKGYDGRVKLYDMQVARGGQAQAPVAQPVPAAPVAQAPAVAAFPAPAPAVPQGFAPPAQPGAPAPWSQ